MVLRNAILTNQGLKQEERLTVMLLNIVSEYTVRKLHADINGILFHISVQTAAYSDDINIRVRSFLLVN
jgi:hypothetical protein